MSTLVHGLKSSAELFPHRVAISCGNDNVTYQQLWLKVCRGCAFLKENGLERGDRVAIVLENSPEYIIAYYAALASGCIAVGLNTAAKSRDIETWLKHCDASCLFVDTKDTELTVLLNHISKDTIIIGVGEISDDVKYTSYWSTIFEGSYKDVDLGILKNVNQAAAIIYTSGTTGSPKGVTLSHLNLHSNITSILKCLPITEQDSILTILPFYYSYGNSILHTHLAVGARLVIENKLLYPHKILERMVSEGITGFSGVPSTYSLLLNRTTLENFDLSSVKYMTSAGGHISIDNIQKITDALPHVSFFAMYGQTEASARLSCLPSDMNVKKQGSIGLAIPGVTLEIRGADGNVVKSGISGEIYASGDNIMLGYWDSPNLTQQVMSNNWLKTGDIAHYDSDGYLYIDGRSSEMIKVGSHRISPQEIEEVIVALESVEEVAAIGVPDEILGQVVKVFIVPVYGQVIDKRSILSHCKNSLASYKIPKCTEFITALPKTASGKIRRNLL